MDEYKDWKPAAFRVTDISNEYDEFWMLTKEDLYQEFKARLIEELAVESSELINLAEIVELAANKDKGE